MVDARGTEDDEAESSSAVPDNTLGRLLTLADGVFAIAMTLLALTLAVPELGAHPSESALANALGHNSDAYWSYVLSFFLIGGYWQAHNRLMRSVTASHRKLVEDTLRLLFVIAALPFPTGMLARYGGVPISLAIYGGTNALATIFLLAMRRDVIRLDLVEGNAEEQDDQMHRIWWGNLVVFLLCIPAGWVIGGKGPYVLILLTFRMVLSGEAWVQRVWRRRRLPRLPSR